LNVSSFSNWTTRFKCEASGKSSSPEPTFFKAVAQSDVTSPLGEVRTLIVQGVSLGFEHPIGPEALSVWIQAIKWKRKNGTPNTKKEEKSDTQLSIGNPCLHS
jgi:hypothetical protein